MKLLQEIAQNKNICKPVIYGLSSTELSDEEKLFFAKSGALGFILFKRNISDKEQVKNLTNSIKELMGSDVLILIDQEGGRVSRMQPPIWNEYPSGNYFAKLYQEDKEASKIALFNNFQKIAGDLSEVGINVDCAPVLDISYPQTHSVIGDRAYGNNHQQVADLAIEVCNALLSKDVYPVIKHIPGHGRATCDSHLELPKVNCTLEELRATDFKSFIALNQQKFAMTAHILYDAIDSQNCATTSNKAIELIRNEIGFKNILMSDDISMKALKGSFGEKTTAILNAGCDLVLHCNGNMQEMLEINAALPNITDDLRQKLID